ncbi:hypothetical protein NE261_05440 [Enterococcus italicus]|uniref:hypothetical protein n=1 Tax=Enterococcus italicus TaxID=246144 RepID=UPI002072FC7E|nr:hypothetical protein [Enterococcus italicus]MCM6931253.1 hypothetical protein [Enterococcus italicus]
MSELLDSAIEEINRVLIGNKDRNTEEVYLKNAIRYIREYGSQPQLNENQLEVLEWLKRLFGKYDYLFDKSIFYSIYDFTSDAGNGINITFEQPLSLKEEVQVLQAFSQWALEQEEE